MEYSNLMLTFIFGLIMCAGIVTSGEPKCMLNESNESAITYDDNKGLKLQTIPSVVTMIFKNFVVHLKGELEQLRDNMEVLTDIYIRSRKIIRRKQNSLQKEPNGMPQDMQKMSRPAFGQFKNRKNNSDLMPLSNLRSLVNQTTGSNYIVFFKGHNFRLANETLSATA
ncbi:uncharacterized protein LOC108149974 [Drosophila elegans]|uniref:uncharacterized protein LOC108149974 n=1 Tax=Drosophila elegans TaxID=30023 RepID=UPI0007E7573C|nr:uncharacterized protein LOC108149974 [Drosophila elegans]